MWKRIAEIIRKEFRQALREPRMRALLIGPPVMQLIVFGFAVNLDVERARLGWMDFDRTPESRELLAEFEGSPRIDVVATPANDAEARRALDSGRVQAVVQALPGFARDIHRGRTAAVQILVDGSNSNTASIVAGYANQVVARYSGRLMAERQRSMLVSRTMMTGKPASLQAPTLDVRSRVWFNPELRSRIYFVPGVVVNIIAIVTLTLTAMAIVREKEIGTMEQLMVTPIRPGELIVGKMLPFAIIGVFDVVLVTAAALAIFQIPFRGNALLLLAGSLLFLVTTVGSGLFISTVSKTQQQAMMASFFFFMPAFMLSGFAFPIRNMPEAVQYLTYLNPVRYFMEMVRGIFLKGAGLTVLWPQMAALLVFGVAILGFSALRFHKRMD